MNSAIFSPFGKYRYRLDRDVFPERMDFPIFAFFGINGSKAGAVENDHTVLKWNGFCRLWGVRRYITGNAFGFMTTQVQALAGCQDPVGISCDHYLREIIAEAHILVPCWGSRTKVPQNLRCRFAVLKAMLFNASKPVMVFGLTRTGDPVHPLMLPYSTKLQEWRP